VGQLSLYSRTKDPSSVTKPRMIHSRRLKPKSTFPTLLRPPKGCTEGELPLSRNRVSASDSFKFVLDERDVRDG